MTLKCYIKTPCVSARHFRLIHIPAACPFISVRTNTNNLRCDEQIFMEITLEKTQKLMSIFKFNLDWTILTTHLCVYENPSP